MHKSTDVIIETDRLFLKEFSLSDSKDFFKLNSDFEVMKYTGDVAFKSVSEAEHFLKNYSDYSKNGYGRWSVFIKETHQYIGWCGLKLNDNNIVDIGFRFFRKEWGKGYATESAKASLEYGFTKLNIKEIIGRASLNNKASIKVLEKLGMILWEKGGCEGIENCIYYRINIAEFNN